MTKKKAVELSAEQATAYEILQSGENVFLTGGAGSGKSFLIRQFRNDFDPKQMPLLASTGAAAVIVGGRTFHSFFGLGIMDGGSEATFARAKNDQRLMRRLSDVEGVIIDEISMIPGEALSVAERLAKAARGSDLPWGGMRMITVGDFAQLPPVTRQGQKRDWCFMNSVWARSGFVKVELSHNQRVQDDEFLDILSDVRWGKVTPRVRAFLDSRMREHDPDEKSTRLFPLRDQAAGFNQTELAEISKPEVRIPSIYLGSEKHIEVLKKSAPLPGEVVLKEGCHVMFLQNDPQKRWVNGTRGTVLDVQADKVIVEKSHGREVTVEKTSFALQDADGNVVASMINFPLTLAYATTIHKSQGATLDKLWVDLTRLWEPGHAYVALSRLTSGEGLKLLGWSKRSFMVDLKVKEFYFSN